MPGLLASMYQRTWWSLLIRGIAAIVFGILALVWPGHVLETIITILGIFVLVVGIVFTLGAVTHRGPGRHWLRPLIPGIIGIVIGIITIAWPGLVTIVIIFLIAAWALIHGIGEIHAALHLRKDIAGEWMPLVIGIASIVIGVILFLMPYRFGELIIWLVGLFVLILGILWLIMAFRARKWKDLVQ
jgi:uncharacterized membrane protein HdeD (DUF308 family)